MSIEILRNGSADFTRVLDACERNNVDPFAFALMAIFARMNSLDLSSLTFIRTMDNEGNDILEAHGTKASEVEMLRLIQSRADA